MKYFDIEFTKPNEFNFTELFKSNRPVIQIPITFLISSRCNGKQEFYERMKKKNEPFRKNN